MAGVLKIPQSSWHLQNVCLIPRDGHETVDIFAGLHLCPNAKGKSIVAASV